jgi:hypothetical protein
MASASPHTEFIAMQLHDLHFVSCRPTPQRISYAYMTRKRGPGVSGFTQKVSWLWSFWVIAHYKAGEPDGTFAHSRITEHTWVFQSCVTHGGRSNTWDGRNGCMAYHGDSPLQARFLSPRPSWSITRRSCRHGSCSPRIHTMYVI